MKKRNYMIAFFVVASLLFGGCAKVPAADNVDQNAEKAEETEGEKISGTVTFTFDLSKYEEGANVRLWVPIAQSNDQQEIEDIKFDAGDTAAEVDMDALGNKMLYIEWDDSVKPEERKATCSFHVIRKEILNSATPKNGFAEISDQYLKEYLEESSMVPVTGEVKDLAEEIVKGEKTNLGKARAIYDWIVQNMNRDDTVKGCGNGDVCILLERLSGKCVDINSVFIGLCRSVGIPAKEMFGVRLNAGDITTSEHCWADFYISGTGWVAADPADVLKAVLKNDWEKESDETKEVQEYYWGNNDAHRVELSQGRDIILAPAQHGEALNNFGYPYGEVNGEMIDYYDPENFSYTIEFAED